MSGSSLDGLDVAYCAFRVQKKTARELLVEDWQLLAAQTIPFSQKWRDRLLGLPAQSARIYAQTDIYFGYYMGELIQPFLNKLPHRPHFIASHGHTIFHEPDRRFTAQIGHGGALAATTGIPVIHDFRIQDVALSGEGAPIAPVADWMLYKGYDFYLNIGGIANISAIFDNGPVAFDVVGANQVLNALAQLRHMPFDENGNLARQGVVNENLLNRLSQKDFFSRPYPKSLSNDWVSRELTGPVLAFEDSIENRMRTVCELIARQVQNAVGALIKKKESPGRRPYRILVTGGGALNGFLMERIESCCADLGDLSWIVPENEIVEYKEAVLMALMGVLRAEKVPNCFRAVTGARRDSTGGCISYP